MLKEINKRVVVIHWKRFAGIDIDVFSSLKGFCDSYPAYNYHTLNNYLSKRKIPFENDEIKIERQLLIKQVRTPIFRKNYSTVKPGTLDLIHQLIKDQQLNPDYQLAANI